MSVEFEKLASTLNETLLLANIALTPAQLEEVAKTLTQEGYRLTKASGPYIAERIDGHARRIEDKRSALKFAGDTGKILQRREILTPLETVSPSDLNPQRTQR